VLRRIARRFGPASEAVTVRINALDAEAVGQLGEALLEFRTAEDLDDWLAERQGA